MELEKESDAKAVADLFQARIDSQVQGGAFYPETIESWKKAQVLTKGRVVALISAQRREQINRHGHRQIEKQKRKTGKDHARFLLFLVFFKYWDFIAVNVNTLTGLSVPVLGLPLPIGVSFYTFQTMSYTIDVYRRDAPVQRSVTAFGAYVTLFPQLIEICHRRQNSTTEREI